MIKLDSVWAVIGIVLIVVILISAIKNLIELITTDGSDETFYAFMCKLIIICYILALICT